jgi:Undecaprenyl-phosphate glucose phosphotransferase
MVKQQHQVFVALLAVADGLVATVACYLAWGLHRMRTPGYFPSFPDHWESWVKNPIAFFVVPILLVIMQVSGLYRPRRDGSIFREQFGVLRAAVMTFAAVVVVLWLVDNELAYEGRSQLAMLGLFLALLLSTHRMIFRIGLRWMRSRGWNLRHVVVIGSGRLGQIACRTLERNSWTGIKVVYFISHREHTRRTTVMDRPVRGGLDEMEKILDEYPVDAVYLALPNSQASLFPELIQRLERFAVDVRIIPDVQPRHLPAAMGVSELEGMPILSIRECPLYGLGGVSKRAIDIIGASIGLLIFSPVMLACVIAVRLSGPGRVIFKQRRVSIAGETFKIYKFRTMYHVEDEKYGGWNDDKWTVRDDPRVTPIGKFMRKTSLDELPQLLNVLKGQMSLVGPRPERPELILRFREDWRGYMLRQHVKAGITGWAQVNGLRGDTSLKKRLQYDLHYIRHWSIMFDLKILALTVVRGFFHRNAH